MTNRKELVTAISEILGCAPIYKRAPTFAYEVQNYTIDRYGMLVAHDQADTMAIEPLLAALENRGFISDGVHFAENPEVNLSASDPTEMNTSSDDFPSLTDADRTFPDSSSNNFPNRLAIEIPSAGFSETSLLNIKKIVASKATLIKKSIGVSDLPVIEEEGRLCFPWFEYETSPVQMTAYTQFIDAICKKAKVQKSVQAKEKPVENEKYAFRCFLLRLGFIGGEFAEARKLLLKNLTGNSSYKSGGHRRFSEGTVTAATNCGTVDINVINVRDAENEKIREEHHSEKWAPVS